MQEHSYALVLLDLMLPGITGEAVLAEIRKKGNLPVIVLTAKDSLDEKVKVLTSGADDYITKPFEIREVLARIQVQLRHTEEKEIKESNLSFREMVLNKATFQAAANGIVFGELEWGNTKAILSYFVTELALHYALVLICMAIAIILKNNVISMVIAVCLSMNVMTIVYGVINSAIQKIGIQNFQIYKYTITGKLSLLPMNPSGAENGDITTIDFEGFVDGEAFEGGKGTDYPLTLGSNSFIPGFEDQLVGSKAGDHVEVKVTFPEEYQAKELAGKEAVFQCDVKKVEAKELPELDDDFAQDVSEFDTLAEYKEDVKKNLTEKKEKAARTAKENAAVDKAIENAEMDIPDAMLNTQVRQMLDDFSRRMQSQGLTMEQYFQFTGMTLDKMQEEMKPQALKRIQTRLVLEKIAEVENIQPTEEEVEEEFKKMADAYKMEVEKIKELLGDRELEQMKKDMAVQKAVTLIADEAKEA